MVTIPFTIILVACLLWYWGKVQDRNTLISEIYLTMEMSTKLNDIHEQLVSVSPLTLPPQTYTDIHSYHRKTQKQLLNFIQPQYELLTYNVFDSTNTIQMKGLTEVNQKLMNDIIAYREQAIIEVRLIGGMLSQSTFIIISLFIATLLSYIYLIYFTLNNILKPLQQATMILTEAPLEPSLKKLNSIQTQSLELTTLFKSVDESHHHQERARILSQKTANEKVKYINFLSHELRTPLNAMLENASQLQSDRTTVELKDLYLGSLHLKEIVNNILNKTKMDSFSQKLAYSEVNLVHIMDKVTLSVKHLQNYYRIHGVVEVDDNVPMNFISDSFVIQQVLVNIISNTIKHSQSKSYKVKVRYLRDSTLQLSIIDKGIGIDKTLLTNIFSPHTQQNNNLDSSGLGMTIAGDLTSLLGGSIKVYSKLGYGSVFIVQLPIGQKTNATQYRSFLQQHKERDLVIYQCLAPYMTKSIKQWPNDRIIYSDSLPTSLYVPFNLLSHEPPFSSDGLDEQLELTRLRQLNILVAEDYELNIRLLSRFAHKHQLSMEFVKNGQDVIEKARTSNYDLILMDYKMPILDGLEAAKELRLWFSKEKLPILMLTANTDEVIVNSRNAQFINGFIQKPITLNALIQEIADITFDKTFR